MKSIKAVFLSVLFTLALVFSVQADPTTNLVNVTLAWDKSPDVTVTSYSVYWGIATRTYTNAIVGITGTNITVMNLKRGVAYHFAATAVNNAGLESDYSAEVVYTAPIPPLPPTGLRVSGVSP